MVLLQLFQLLVLGAHSCLEPGDLLLVACLAPLDLRLEILYLGVETTDLVPGFGQVSLETRVLGTRLGAMCLEVLLRLPRVLLELARQVLAPALPFGGVLAPVALELGRRVALVPDRGQFLLDGLVFRLHRHVVLK